MRLMGFLIGTTLPGHCALQDFEQVVLETALENVVSKYSRHLEIIKPALEMLLQQVPDPLLNQ